MDRRTFLRGTGRALSLPWLEAMGLNSTSFAKAGELAAGEVPARAVFTCWGMGMNHFSVVPEKTGPDFALPASVKPLSRSERNRPISPRSKPSPGGINRHTAS